jgi:1,4-alpha-glucan branching enzyme
MSVAVEGAVPLAMSRSDDGWYEAEANCGAGARYRYILQDGTAVPDPAARAQHGDVNGASIVVDPLRYHWRHPDWQGRPWHEAVLYEAHAGVLGGFAGVARELPRLAALGVTAVELMPIAEFPGGRNWGYDGALLFAPGLRLDAVHAIADAGWLDEMAAEVARTVESGRHVHLVLENDDNAAAHLARGFDAQWNDDGHHVLHVLLTGEHEGYYEDYADRPAERLARCLKEGFIYQGEPSSHRGGKPRGTASGDLAPTAFVLFLQNHDQIGNRAFGERLTHLAHPKALEAAIALLLLCPQIPLLFMGEEGASTSPFLFFTEHTAELAQAVRDGRRREFAKFSQFADPKYLDKIPDPNAAETFEHSKPAAVPAQAADREPLYRHLLALRHSEIVPRLAGARAVDARVVGPAAVTASWRMGDGSLLSIAVNLAANAAEMPKPHGRLLFASSDAAASAARQGRLQSYSTVAVLEPP